MLAIAQHPAHRRAVPDAGRADRGPCAGNHPADRPYHRAPQDRKGSRSFWSNRISGSPRPSRTATTSSNTARSSMALPIRSCKPTWTSFTPISASEQRLQAGSTERKMKNTISALLLGTAAARLTEGWSRRSAPECRPRPSAPRLSPAACTVERPRSGATVTRAGCGPDRT